MSIRAVTEREKRKFFRGIFERSRRRRNPFSVMFELTYGCNFNCSYCYRPGSRREANELKTKEIFAILNQLKDMGVYQIGFTGGEPLVREDIFDILGYANRCGFKCDLLTNGFLIDKKTIKRLKSVNADRIEISFNSLRPQVFEGLTGIKGSFKKVERAIHLLKEGGFELTIKSVCMRINKDDIVQINKFVRKLEVIYKIDGEIIPCRDRYMAQVDNSISQEEYQVLMREIYPEMFKGRRPYLKSRRKRDIVVDCGAGMNFFSINPYGKMSLCLLIDYPECDILSEGAVACWNKIKREVDRINSGKDFVCKNCQLIKYCDWCIGRSYLESGNFNTCSPFLKERALTWKKRRQKDE